MPRAPKTILSEAAKAVMSEATKSISPKAPKNYDKSSNTVVPRYNDHLYNGNFDFRQNFFGNGSFLMKIYYTITEFALSDIDGDSRRRIAFLTHFLFIKMTEKKNPINCLPANIFNLP